MDKMKSDPLAGNKKMTLKRSFLRIRRRRYMRE
jgi:hypothetical protein